MEISRTYEELLEASIGEPITLPDMADPPPDPHIPDIIGADEAAEILDRTRAMVSVLANGGKLPGRRVGNRWVFRRVVVERYAAKLKSSDGE